ncbi:hypothetical protein [Actinomadura sp. NPDC048394]|uniref:hypothetical protein n=1 Tax=Actinomadura sp. NPDC048394 TaxID=3158223 RepID=UPI003403166C
MHRRSPARSLLTAATLLICGAAPFAVPSPDGTARAAETALNASDVTANLWEWNWNSVAKACTDQLGPAGYGAVQVAPPAESVSLASTGDGAPPPGGRSTSPSPTP